MSLKSRSLIKNLLSCITWSILYHLKFLPIQSKSLPQPIPLYQGSTNFYGNRAGRYTILILGAIQSLWIYSVLPCSVEATDNTEMDACVSWLHLSPVTLGRGEVKKSPTLLSCRKWLIAKNRPSPMTQIRLMHRLLVYPWPSQVPTFQIPIIGLFPDSHYWPRT